MSNFIDLTGKRFGRLTVICRDEDIVRKNGKTRPTWRCKCDCGNVVTILGESLRRGLSSSCGCFRRDELSNRKTHGGTDSRMYRVWCAIKARCLNKNTVAYKDYGARGITICDDWKSSYESFRDWALCNGYQEKLSIDRIDNNQGYSPENCRWVDAKAQANNRRSNRIYEIDGETHNLTEWANLRGVNPKTLYSRMYSGMSFEEALNYKRH